MIRSEWPRIFPLCISDSIGLADLDPSIFASRNSRTLVRLLKPWDNTRPFRLVASMCFIVVRECAVKRVLLRCKFYRDVIAPMGRIRIIETAVAFGPLFIPRTCVIGDEVMSTWLFADPKDRGYNICFPRIRPCTKRAGRFSDDRFALLRNRFRLSSDGAIKRDESETTKAK